MATTTTQENIAVARRLLEETFGEGKLELIDELCVDGYVDHDPIMGDRGRDGVKGHRRRIPRGVPRSHVRGRMHSPPTTRSSFAGRPRARSRTSSWGRQPTGDKGEPVYGIGIDRFEDGKVAESWTQWDTLRFMRNIGAMPEAAEAPAAV